MNENNNKAYLLGIGVAVGLALLKRYFTGAYSPVSRNMHADIAVVTGGNTGIGRETVFLLARKGCTVIMGSRDHVKSEAALDELRKETKNANIFYCPLDLASKASVEQFANYVKQRYVRVDILINNAAVFCIPERTLNGGGHEVSFAVNHLGHFYLTSLLWPLLKISDRPRIINVSALAHKVNLQRNFPMTLDFQKLDGSYPAPGPKFGRYDPWYAYCASKLANVLFTLQLAKRAEKVNPEVRVVSLHPGIVRTELVRYLVTGWKKAIKWLFYPLVWLFTKSPLQGAQTTIYCAMQSTGRIKNGGYYSDCKLSSIADFAQDPTNQKALWVKSEQMLAITFQVS